MVTFAGLVSVLSLFMKFRRQVVQAHWHQAKYVETLFHEEEMLLYYQPNMVRKTQSQIC